MLRGSTRVEVAKCVFQGLDEGLDVYQVNGVLFYDSMYLGQSIFFYQGDSVGETELFGGKQRSLTRSLRRSWAVN